MLLHAPPCGRLNGRPFPELKGHAGTCSSSDQKDLEQRPSKTDQRHGATQHGISSITLGGALCRLYNALLAGLLPSRGCDRDSRIRIVVAEFQNANLFGWLLCDPTALPVGGAFCRILDRVFLRFLFRPFLEYSVLGCVLEAMEGRMMIAAIAVKASCGLLILLESLLSSVMREFSHLDRMQHEPQAWTRGQD